MLMQAERVYAGENNNADTSWVGNTKLLETIDAHHEILQTRGGCECQVTKEFHFRILGGEFRATESCNREPLTVLL